MAYIWGFPNGFNMAGEGLPYSNFHELNLDWILQYLQKFNKDIQQIPQEIIDQIEKALDEKDFNQIIADYLATMGVVNVKLPPNDLQPASGDGTTDDTETIQGCIDYCAALGKGTVFFPNGSYLTGSLDMKNNVSLVGMDRYTTAVVLKGGATRALLNGEVNNVSIRDIQLNGASGTQVENVNVVELTAGELLIDNVLIRAGYELLSLTSAGGNWQLSNIVMEQAGLSACELLKGTVDSNVVCSNWNIGSISQLLGRYAINVGLDNVVFDNVFIDTPIAIAVNCGASHVQFEGHIIGAQTPMVDNGDMNSWTIYGLRKTEKFSGAVSEQAGSFERDVENGIVDNAENITSNAQQVNTVSGTDVILNPINPLTYNKTPKPVNKYFDYVPLKNDSGIYKILTDGSDFSKLDYLTGLNFLEVDDYNPTHDGTIHTLSERFSTIEEAKAVYSVATELTNSIDWCAIQQCINDAIEKHMNVYINAGEYAIHTFIDIDNSDFLINVIGSGVYSCRITSAISGFYIHGISEPSHYRSYQHVGNFLVTHLGDGTYIGNGVQCEQCAYIHLFNIACINMNNGFLFDGVEHSRFETLQGETCSKGVYAPQVELGTKTAFNNNVFISCIFTRNITGLEAWYGCNIMLIGCSIENNNNAGIIGINMCYQGGVGFIIIGCYFENNIGQGHIAMSRETFTLDNWCAILIEGCTFNFTTGSNINAVNYTGINKDIVVITACGFNRYNQYSGTEPCIKITNAIMRTVGAVGNIAQLSNIPEIQNLNSVRYNADHLEYWNGNSWVAITA